MDTLHFNFTNFTKQAVPQIQEHFTTKLKALTQDTSKRFISVTRSIDFLPKDITQLHSTVNSISTTIADNTKKLENTLDDRVGTLKRDVQSKLETMTTEKLKASLQDPY